MTASAKRLDDDLLGEVRPVIRLLLVASALVMLVAILNVGALFLALGLTKRQELAVRVSLGATPRRLLLLALSDASIVATAGAVLGVAIAYGVVRLVVAFASTQLPRTDAIQVNGATLAVAVALAVLATASFAIACVYGQQRAEPLRALQAATRSGTGTRTARRTQRAMVVAQVALAVTVILGAGLVARSQLHLETLDLGLAGDRILMIEVVPPQQDDYAHTEGIQRRRGPDHRDGRGTPRRAGCGAAPQPAVWRHVRLGCAVPAGRTGAGGGGAPAAAQSRNRVTGLLPDARHRDRPGPPVHHRGRRPGTTGRDRE